MTVVLTLHSSDKKYKLSDENTDSMSAIAPLFTEAPANAFTMSSACCENNGSMRASSKTKWNTTRVVNRLKLRAIVAVAVVVQASVIFSYSGLNPHKAEMFNKTETSNETETFSKTEIFDRTDTFKVAPLEGRTVTYLDGGRGQGLGNIMNGLIAAYLLSIESKRCLIVQWPSFELMFRSKRKCLRQYNSTRASVDYWNFGHSDSGARLRSLLESDVDDVTMRGNEYPNSTWPLVPSGSFYDLFEPRFTDEVETVDTLIHVRVGDNSHDRRAGEKYWAELQDRKSVV